MKILLPFTTSYDRNEITASMFFKRLVWLEILHEKVTKLKSYESWTFQIICRYVFDTCWIPTHLKYARTHVGHATRRAYFFYYF